jgi:hypothetical protein
MVLPCTMSNLPCIVVDLRVPPCTEIDPMILLCIVVDLVVPPCMVVDPMVLPCILVDLMVPPCMVVGPMDLPYIFFEGVVVLESWGSQIDWENFLAKE